MNNKKLTIQSAGKDASPVLATSNTKFALKGEDTQMEFNKNIQGNIKGLTVFNNGQKTLKKRM